MWFILSLQPYLPPFSSSFFSSHLLFFLSSLLVCVFLVVSFSFSFLLHNSGRTSCGSQVMVVFFWYYVRNNTERARGMYNISSITYP